jgi:hypothetical protein
VPIVTPSQPALTSTAVVVRVENLAAYPIKVARLIDPKFQVSVRKAFQVGVGRGGNGVLGCRLIGFEITPVSIGK